MIEALSRALEARPYSMDRYTREPILLSGLNELTAHHYEKCEPYRRIIDGAWGGKTSFDSLEDVPYLPVSLFKTQKLQSVPTPTCA